MIYINKTENRITFKIQIGYYLKLLTPETMKLLGWVLDISYTFESYTFVPNTLLGQLFDISSKNAIFLKTFNSETWDIEAWLTDQNSKFLEMEDKNIKFNKHYFSNYLMCKI